MKTLKKIFLLVLSTASLIHAGDGVEEQRVSSGLGFTLGVACPAFCNPISLYLEQAQKLRQEFDKHFEDKNQSDRQAALAAYESKAKVLREKFDKALEVFKQDIVSARTKFDADRKKWAGTWLQNGAQYDTSHYINGNNDSTEGFRLHQAKIEARSSYDQALYKAEEDFLSTARNLNK